MLRIDSTVLRVILLCIGFCGIALFLLPMFTNIVNIGNGFGLVCSILLVGFVIWNRQISGLLDRIRQHTAGRLPLRIVGIVIVLGVLYCLIMSVLMLHASYRKPKQQPQAMIVLGCRVRGTAPSRMLARRIHAAYDALQENPEMIAVVSGGKGSNEDISEAQCMLNELTKMGIPESRILMEDKSTSTSENLRFSKKILDENGITGNLLLVTDGYHEMRAQILAKKEGLPQCDPASAYTSWYLVPTYWVREWFGLAHAFVFGN